MTKHEDGVPSHYPCLTQKPGLRRVHDPHADHAVRHARPAGSVVHRLLIGTVAAIAVFVALALWNGAVAVLFAIVALTWLLARLYRWSVGGDIFGGDERRE